MKLEEFKLRERIKLSYLVNRGDIDKVVADVGDVSEVYVRRVAKKIRNREDRDYTDKIANNLSSHILIGHNQRMAHLTTLMEKLDKGYEQQFVSTCCRSTVFYKEGLDGKDIAYCHACRRICTVSPHIDKEDVYMRATLIDKMRKEDEHLVKFAKDMGYVGKPDDDKPKVIEAESIPLTAEDIKQIEMMKNLQPHQVDDIIKQLERVSGVTIEEV